MDCQNLIFECHGKGDWKNIYTGKCQKTCALTKSISYKGTNAKLRKKYENVVARFTRCSLYPDQSKLSKNRLVNMLLVRINILISSLLAPGCNSATNKWQQWMFPNCVNNLCQWGIDVQMRAPKLAKIAPS